MVKVTGSLQRSTEIMKLSNQLIKLPQINAAMREMSMEMTKVKLVASSFTVVSQLPQAGIMEEMLEDTLEGLDEDPELEEEAEQEVDRVLFEITDGKLGVAGAGKELPVSTMLLDTRGHSHCFTDSQRQGGGRGHRPRNGTHAGSTEQFTQWIILYLLLSDFCVIYLYPSLKPLASFCRNDRQNKTWPLPPTC